MLLVVFRKSSSKKTFNFFCSLPNFLLLFVLYWEGDYWYKLSVPTLHHVFPATEGQVAGKKAATKAALGRGILDLKILTEKPKLRYFTRGKAFEGKIKE